MVGNPLPAQANLFFTKVEYDENHPEGVQRGHEQRRPDPPPSD